MATILLVDDEPSLVATLDYNLRREGYQVLIARDGEAALEQAKKGNPDLILLDVMLPKVSGIEVCREIRRTSLVPILMLTARDGEVDKVLGLEIGADDYMTKPFSMRELMARVKARLRRATAVAPDKNANAEPGDVLSFDGVEINVPARTVARDGQRLHLKPREFELLTFLARNRGRVFSRDELLRRVWDHDFVGDTRTVDVHVRWLRSKLERDPAQPHLLQTVRGIGYRFLD